MLPEKKKNSRSSPRKASTDVFCSSLPKKVRSPLPIEKSTRVSVKKTSPASLSEKILPKEASMSHCSSKSLESLPRKVVTASSPIRKSARNMSKEESPSRKKLGQSLSKEQSTKASHSTLLGRSTTEASIRASPRRKKIGPTTKEEYTNISSNTNFERASFSPSRKKTLQSSRNTLSTGERKFGKPSSEVFSTASRSRNKLMQSPFKNESRNVSPSKKLIKSPSKEVSKPASCSRNKSPIKSKEESRNVSPSRKCKKSPLKEVSRPASCSRKESPNKSQEESRNVLPSRKLGKTSKEVSRPAACSRKKLPSMSKDESRNVIPMPSRKMEKSPSKEVSRAKSTDNRKMEKSPSKELSIDSLPCRRKLMQPLSEESRDVSPNKKLGNSPCRGSTEAALPTHIRKSPRSREFPFRFISPNKVFTAMQPPKRSHKKLPIDASPPKKQKVKMVTEKEASPMCTPIKNANSSKSSPRVKKVIPSIFKSPRKDINDDSPLPSPLKSLFTSSKKRSSFGSPKKRSPRRSPKKNSRYYHQALDEILNEVRSDSEQDLKNKELEEKLQHVISDSHQLPNGHEINAISRLTDPSTDRIQEPPPGLKILEPISCFCYFSDVEDIIDLDKFFTSDMPTTPYETKLSQLSVDFVPEFIVRGGFVQSPSMNRNPNPGMLTFLLHLMAIHEGKEVVTSCQNAFKHYASTCDQDFRWCPTPRDVVSIFLNFGILVSSIEDCPVKEYLLAVYDDVLCHNSLRKKAKRMRHLEPTFHECSCKRKHAKIADYFNIRAVLETLTLCIQKWNIYCSTRLCDLILLLCWLALDKQLLQEGNHFAVKRFITISLATIAEEEWLEKLSYLTEKLMQLGSHHRNMLHIISLMPPCRRGIQLQQSTAFAAIQSLMGCKPIIHTCVTPKKILQFLKDNPLDEQEDSYLLYSIVLMLDISVGNNMNGQEAVVQALGNLLMRTFSTINDSLLCIERTRLKNLLVTIRSKWVFIIQTLPVLKMNSCAKQTSIKEEQKEKTSLCNGSIRQFS